MAMAKKQPVDSALDVRVSEPVREEFDDGFRPPEEVGVGLQVEGKLLGRFGSQMRYCFLEAVEGLWAWWIRGRHHDRTDDR